MSRPTLVASLRTLPLLARVNLALLALAVVAASIRLWPEWRGNPDLSHGMFMPAVFLFLLYEARNGTARYLPFGAAARAAFGVLMVGALGTLSLAGLYAAAVDWSHALVDFLIAFSLSFTLATALLLYSSSGRRLIPFNWSGCVAVGLWALTAPLPPGTYTRLTLGLQLWVSENVLRTLHLLGIPAVRHGNIIDLANATVGVEEACSGVRSLISCVFAGLVFSATLVRRPWARALVILLSVPLALGMNFLRSLALTLMVNRGIDISGTWHDVTGFAVLGITAALLGGLALLLERKPAEPVPTASALPQGRVGFDAALTTMLGAAAALTLFFVFNTRSAPRPSPAPDLLALLPAGAAGWQVKTSDLYEFRGTLQTDHLAQRHYRIERNGERIEIIIYVAYWRAGQAPVSLVAAHTPDACWPGSGWSALPVRDPRPPLMAAGHSLLNGEHRIFTDRNSAQNVWFWHVYDGRPIAYQDPLSPIALLKLAINYGFRRAGDQMFVRVSSNRPWAEIATEPILEEFFRRTQPLGL